jgi:hypothetical protein
VRKPGASRLEKPVILGHALQDSLAPLLRIDIFVIQERVVENMRYFSDALGASDNRLDL